jgi:hypothetical protein
VLERAATCAANLATPVAEERLPGPGVRRRISVRVGRWKPDTSLEQWMSNYASRLPEIMRTPINLGCVMNTALEDRKLTVTRAGRTFTVSFGAR